MSYDAARLGKLTASYWDVQKVRISVNNRLDSMIEEDQNILNPLDQLEKYIAKQVRIEVRKNPFWDYWLKTVKGIGEIYAAQLISLITGQKHTSECQAKRDAYYSKKEKGEGKRDQSYECDCPPMEIERFPYISSLWKYAGLHVVDGKAARRRKGQKVDWNPRLRSTCYNIGKSFVINTKGPYRQHYDRFKAEDTEKHPGLSKGHLDARARRKTVKLFLSHLYLKWYELKGLTPTQPYVEEVLEHRHIIPPP